MTKTLKIFFHYVLGPALFLILMFSLYRQIAAKPNLAAQWAAIKNNWFSWKLLLVLALMIINWGIEARKWQLLMRHLQPFSIATAFKSVLAGCSITMLTPNRIGEYGGRILYVKAENRIKAISLTIVGSISQLLITLLMGCLGLLFFKYFSPQRSSILSPIPAFWQSIIFYLSAAMTAVLLLFYMRIGLLVRLMEKIPAFNKVVRHIQVLDEFNNKQLLQLLSLSLLRYGIFVLQFIVLLQLMQVAIAGWLCFWLLTLFYWGMSIAPTFGFIELPVRLNAIWLIFKWYTPNEMGVDAATFGIWLINLALPALIGSLLIISTKIFKEE